MSEHVPIHRAWINERLAIVPHDRARWLAYLSRLKNKYVEIIVRSESTRRLRNQNAWYWVQIVPDVARHLSEATGRTIKPEQAHELLKRVFLGVIETPLGPVPRSSATLTIEQFSDYCTQIQAYAASEWGLNIPGPNEVDLRHEDSATGRLSEDTDTATSTGLGSL